MAEGLAVGSAIVAAMLFTRRKSLTQPAAIFLVAVGLVLVMTLGYRWLLLFEVMFLAAMLATKWHARRRHGGFKKSDVRDLFDVMPVALAVAVGPVLFSRRTGAVVALAAMSFMLADILASELGPALSRSAYTLPRFRRVPHGVGGAVSPVGLAFAAIGSGAACAAGLALMGRDVGIAVFLGGQFGSWCDTLLARVASLATISRSDVLIASAGVVVSASGSVLALGVLR